MGVLNLEKKKKKGKEKKRKTPIKVSSSSSGKRGVPEMTGAEPWKQLYAQAHGSHVTGSSCDSR